MEYEIVVGLEVHVKIRTESKMFCGCANRYGAEPNTLACPVCMGMPGVLPVPNREAIRKTVLAGLMTDCSIASFSKFDRKSYFYPDMPKNYQISQYDLPFCEHGGVPISGKGFSGEPLPEKIIGLTRIHLEEDVAKSTHFGTCSGIDFNRAGGPLMEVVSEPDMRSADEAYAYLSELKRVMRYAGISECDMEKGELRCDVNISVRPKGAEKLGVKIEIKNLNSFRSIHRSINYERERQVDAVESGEALRQETRGWNDDLGETYIMRVKESESDYRYFPEPDLTPITLSDEYIEKIRETAPERPDERRKRFMEEYCLPRYDAEVLTHEREYADYFEAAAGGVEKPKAVANWIITELLSKVGGEDRVGIADTGFSPESMAELVGLVDDGTISGKIAKQVFAEALASGDSPKAIVEKKGLRQVTDTSEIEGFVAQAIADNPAQVAQFKDGNEKVLQYFVGQVMKLSRGKANPKMVVESLKRELGD